MANKNRLGVFVFYDKDGIVDDYVPYLLNDLKENLTRLVVVCNGKLTPEGRKTLKAITPDLFVHENKGFDAGAYKSAFEDYLGWDTIRQYDELVMCNDTFYGPFWPFKEVFDKMDERPELDFWGLTICGKLRGTYSDLPEHLQSFFLVVRHALLLAPEFEMFWQGINPAADDVNRVIENFETRFTHYFSNAGFRWAPYANTHELDDKSEQYNLNHSVYNCNQLIEKYHCPIIKRRAFTWDNLLDASDGNNTVRAVQYIKSNTSYDVNLIYRHLLRLYNVAQLKNNLNWDYILQTENSGVKQAPIREKVLVVIHMFYPDLVDECFEYANHIPQGVDVLVTTSNPAIKEEIAQKFSKIQGQFLGVLDAPKRGRDIAGFLIAAREKFLDYDIACFTHDKKMSSEAHYYTIGENFRELILKNVLASDTYIRGILQLFRDNPLLGVLAPPHPFMGSYLNALGNAWQGNFKATQQLIEQLGLEHSCHVDKEHQPYVLGTSLWFRVDALLPLLNHRFEISDFPEEPLPADGTISHAIERVFPYVAQSQGYYSGWVMTKESGEFYVEQLNYMLTGYVNGWTKYFRTVSGYPDAKNQYLDLVQHCSGHSPDGKASRAWGAKEAFFAWDEDLLRAARLAEIQREEGLETIGFASAWAIFRISLGVWFRKHSPSKLQRQMGEFMAEQKMPSVSQTWWLVRKTFGIWIKKPFSRKTLQK